MNSQSRLRRQKLVNTRAKTPDSGVRARCGILHCRNLTTAAAGKGLNRRFCQAHEDRYERHGSPYRGSYSARQLNPYRRAAFDWLAANAEDASVKTGIAGVESLYQNAGPTVEAFGYAVSGRRSARGQHGPDYAEPTSILASHS